MPKRSSKPPKDPNQAAKRLIDLVAGEEDEKPRRKNPAAVSLGRRGGLKGGRARAEKLSPEERANIARLAAQRRWNKPDG